MMRGLGLLLLICGACVDVPEFARPSLIDRPRVLAIIAEPPEASPGQTVELSLLLAGAEQADITWRACGAFDPVLGGGGQFGVEQDEHCGDGGVELEAGKRTRLPGELTTRLFQDLELAATILGSTLPAGTVERVRDEVGLPFIAEATVRADGKLLRAVKRVVISQRPARHANPPAPRFTLAGEALATTSELPNAAWRPAALRCRLRLRPSSSCCRRSRAMSNRGSSRMRCSTLAASSWSAPNALFTPGSARQAASTSRSPRPPTAPSAGAHLPRRPAHRCGS